MHWIIQKNLYIEDNHIDILNFLSRMEIPFTEIEFNSINIDIPLEARMFPFVNPEGLVMLCGSVNLADATTHLNWIPGSFFNDNHDYRVWEKHYGKFLLNYDAIICKFGEVKQNWNNFFIRPCSDTKSFNGKCINWGDFIDWRRRVIELDETKTSLDADTVVMYSPIKEIYREARFFVVDKKIITQSTYKIANKMHIVSEVPPTMIEFAEQMINIWQPARAFVMDIALTNVSNKIVEINCINMSGFYDCDIHKIVMAIDVMEF